MAFQVGDLVIVRHHGGLLAGRVYQQAVVHVTETTITLTNGWELLINEDGISARHPDVPETDLSIRLQGSDFSFEATAPDLAIMDGE